MRGAGPAVPHAGDLRQSWDPLQGLAPTGEEDSGALGEEGTRSRRRRGRWRKSHSAGDGFCNLYPERSMEAVVDPTVEKEPQPREAEEEEKW